MTLGIGDRLALKAIDKAYGIFEEEIKKDMKALAILPDRKKEVPSLLCAFLAFYA